MAPVRPTAGVRRFALNRVSRSALTRGLVPTFILLVFLMAGLPTSWGSHTPSSVRAAPTLSVGAALLAQARATPLPTATPAPASPHPAAAPTPRWTDLQSKVTNQVPAYRYIGTMDYDPIDQYVLLFGGYGNGSTTPYDDTWTFANGLWTQLQIGGPPARYAAMMTWDAGDGYMLLFGGYDSSSITFYNDTWTFVHGVWNQLTPAVSPPVRWRGAMAYDAADNYTVLFGGTPNAGTTAPMKDTWMYKAGSWTNITTNVTGSPAARFRQDMVYDAADGYLVMFGGCTVAACSSQDTLTYHNYTWTLLSPSTKPPVRSYTGLTYDAAQGYVLLFGGVSEATNTGYSDTWEFLNGTWTDLTSGLSTAPSTRGLEMLAYDAFDGYTLLFGGQNPFAGTFLNDTWAFGPSVLARLTVAPATVDLHQSVTLNATPLTFANYAIFNYSGLPPGCTGANVSVLRCTPTSTGFYNVTVSVNDSNGLPTSRNVTFQVNSDLSVTGVNATPSTVTVGTKFHVNVTATGGTLPYAYSYSGLPTGCASADTASLACTPTAAITATITATAYDAVGWNQSLQVMVTVNPSPSLPALVVSPGTIDVGTHFSVWANATGGTAPLTWTYTGLPIPCASVDGPTLTCAPTVSGTYPLRANVTDAYGWAAFATSTIIVNLAPAILGFAVSPAAIDIGQTVTFWLNGTDGTGTLTHGYSGMPAGCNLGRLGFGSCTPTASGTFVITGTITDALGVAVTKTLTLTIGADPSVDAVTVSPARVDVGQTVEITVSVSGGTAPFVYQYSGLPGGCVNTTTSVVTCRPLASGTFNLVAQATDSWRMTSQLGGQLIVNPAPAITEFSASVTPVNVGATTILTTVVSGGSGVFTFAYTNLPKGCTSANVSSLSCTPSVTGTFNVTVTVTDTLGRTASGSTQFVVQTVPTTAGFLGFSGSTGYLIIGLIVLVLLVVVVAAVLLMRRRSGGGDTPPPAEEWQETPAESTET